MKARLITVTCLALMNVSPAFGAPPEIENFCWAQAAQIRFNGRGEREAFIANCIADLTPTPTKRRKYRRTIETPPGAKSAPPEAKLGCKWW